jgi:hypothetical protein
MSQKAVCRVLDVRPILRAKTYTPIKSREFISHFSRALKYSIMEAAPAESPSDLIKITVVSGIV